MMRRLWVLGWWTAMGALLGSAASAGEMANAQFTIRYDERGITSLRRTNDVHDTEYLAPGAALGSLLVRYRTEPGGEWITADEITGGATAPDGTLQYRLGRLLPTLAQRSTPTASGQAAGLRALNDGQTPPPPAAGRGRGARAARGGGAGRGLGGFASPYYTLAGADGAEAWIQYTFPAPEQVASTAVYWYDDGVETSSLRLPLGWQVQYRDGGQWRPVQTAGPYPLEANAFNEISFAPVRTDALRVVVRLAPGTSAGVGEWRVGPAREVAPLDDLAVVQTFRLDADALDWTIALSNRSDRPLEIGDLAVPLRMAESTPGSRGDIYTRKLLRHSYIAGHGSWIYWARSNAVGPFLVLTTEDRTHFEYASNSGPRGGARGFTPYIHATVDSAEPIARAREVYGRQHPWRLPLTSLRLAPAGAPGSQVQYRFRLRWAPDFDGVRQVLYEEGEFDTNIVPGMALPVDLPAMIALRTKNDIRAVEPEFPDRTKVELVAERPDGNKVYKVSFTKLGENMLTVRYGDGQWMSLEFFVMEPLETVIKKRSRFLTTRMQHKDPNQWWYGVYSDWDQLNKVLRSPIDRDGLSPWLTDASDDAGNARPAYVAGKNAFFPDPDEIASVELYIRYYLWNDYRDGKGGMQMTENEPYPYGIYGTFDNWYQHRTSDDPGPNHGTHLWRIYDYPHIINLYHRMYQIAKFYPDLVKFKNAEQYLELAYRTAVAYWTVPLATRNWSANSVGTMNEACIPDLIASLEEEGKQAWADTLRGYWESKVERFINRTPNLYGSEFAFDSTGFESTQAFAHYAMERVLKPGETAPPDLPADDFRRRVTYDAAKKFQDFQMQLNINDRGWLETTYYQLGSDYRGSMTYLLSYMSHLGGWGVLDHGLHFAEQPAPYLRLGYASSLSAWSLVNSGNAESGWGAWWPAPENDGAAGGGFMPEPIGTGWIRKEAPRGAWYYSAEVDVGYVGALRTHATIVTDDPIFGEYAYGGILTRPSRRVLGVLPRTSGAVEVIPRDGLRVRLHVVRGDQRFHLLFDNDGFAPERPIVIADALDRLEFEIENRAGRPHETHLRLAGLPAGEYEVAVGGRTVATLNGGPAWQRFRVPLSGSGGERVRIVRR